MFASSSSLAAAVRGNRIMTVPECCPDAFWDLPTANGCRKRRYELPRSSFDGAHSNILAKNKPTTAQPSISTRHALPDAHGYTLHRTSTHARPREDSHPNTHSFRRRRPHVGAAHAVPPPAHTARAVPDRKQTNERGTTEIALSAWLVRSGLARGNGGLAQVKLITPAPPPRQRPANGPTHRPTRPSAPA